jgi:hypothetical protein
MSEHPPLDAVQRWLLSVITDPRGIAAGIDSPAAQEQLAVTADAVEQVIPRSQACTSIERLAVYGYAYFARLLECLQAEYSVLAKAAGEEAFQSLAAGYLQAHPSTSYTLGQLGAKFPQYLAETRPPRTTADDAPDWADFLIDLSRLERTYAEVFDGPGEEGEPPLDVAQLEQRTASESGDVQLRTSRSLRLLTLQFPVHRSYAGLRRGEGVIPGEPCKTLLAIHRRNYVVQRRELSPEQFTLLSGMQSGLTLDESLAGMLDQHGTKWIDPNPLTFWFQSWTAAGIIHGIEL